MYAGVRPKIQAAGEPSKDFVVAGEGRTPFVSILPSFVSRCVLYVLSCVLSFVLHVLHAVLRT